MHELRTLDFPSASVCGFFQGVNTWAALRQAVGAILDQANLPSEFGVSILLKPNLNNDLTALTGNSTDLRLLRVVIEALQSRGYRKLTIGDGPNFGIRRLGINVFKRLGVDRLAALYGVEIIDFNYDRVHKVELVKSKQTGLAETCFNADYIINLPKIKTHAEAGMSLACKNLVGCNVGISKKRVHDDLPHAITELNQLIKPSLHIVDGLVAMEGNGPGDGIPRKLGLLFAGRDPFLLDAVVSHLVSIGSENLLHLLVARSEDLISDVDWDAVPKLSPLLTLLPPPHPCLIARVLTRNSLTLFRDLIRPLFANKPVLTLLRRLRIVQDIYETNDGMVTLHRLAGKSTKEGLTRASAYCPMELAKVEIASDPPSARCIGYLYCYWVGAGAIQLEGQLDYLDTHIRRFRDLVAACVGTMWTGGRG
jgi:uncharacterized protein (DUF362 family)